MPVPVQGMLKYARHVLLLHYILFLISFARDVLIRLIFMGWFIFWFYSWSLVYGCYCAYLILHCTYRFNACEYHQSVSPFLLAPKAKGISFCNNIGQGEIHLSMQKKNTQDVFGDI